MTKVTIKLWEGRTEEEKQSLKEALARTVSEVLPSVPEGAVKVLIEERPNPEHAVHWW